MYTKNKTNFTVEKSGDSASKNEDKKAPIKSEVVGFKIEKDKVTIEGNWRYGLAETFSDKPETHLRRAVEDERIRNETHIPINNNNIIQVIRTSTEKGEFVIEVEPVILVDYSKKEEQGE
jgi:hypothetical protein